jgi:hypothetical protein
MLLTILDSTMVFKDPEMYIACPPWFVLSPCIILFETSVSGFND